jgi:polar amino acid transport system substrate-binding protein
MKNTLNPKTAKDCESSGATLWRLKLIASTLLLVVNCSISTAQELKQPSFPGFRHVDSAGLEASHPTGGSAILLADEDFAPWSFVDAQGNFKGIAVELAQQACAEVLMTCDVRPLAFAKLQTAVRSGEAQGIVAGPKLEAGTAEEFAVTRPFFQTLGRFAVRTGSPLSAPDIRTLAGRRIGFLANSAHARFLEAHYARSALMPFETNGVMLEALRTGQVDAIFGDAVQVSFWLGGKASRGCCAFLGKAFVDRATFTRSMMFMLKKDDPKLRQKLDDALDRLEANGATAEIFSRYIPTSVW